MSLRERLLALADARIDSGRASGAESLALAAARLALDEAALECERTPLLMSYEQHRPQSYYCAARIRALAEGLDK